MAGNNLDAIIGRAVREPEFRKRVLSDSKGVASEYNLSANEMSTLENFNKDAADEFFSKVVGGRRIMYCTSKTCCETG